MKLKCNKCNYKAEYLKDGTSYCIQCLPKDYELEISEEDLRATLGHSLDYETEE